MENKKQSGIVSRSISEAGRVGYFILWLMGVPFSLLVILWLFLGNNIFGPG